MTTFLHIQYVCMYVCTANTTMQRTYYIHNNLYVYKSTINTDVVGNSFKKNVNCILLFVFHSLSSDRPYLLRLIEASFDAMLVLRVSSSARQLSN